MLQAMHSEEPICPAMQLQELAEVCCALMHGKTIPVDCCHPAVY